MNFDQLQSCLQNGLQASGQPGLLTISQTTFNSDRLTQLLNTYYSGTPIVISNASLGSQDVSTTQIVISGNASFLNVADMPVQATFQAAPDGVDMFLCYQLPPTWKFSQSFPALPATWTPTPGLLSSTSSWNSLLDMLTFTEASFIVSTMPYTDSMYQLQVSSGLTFASHLKLNGILGALEQTLTIPEPLTLAGPIILSSPTSTATPDLPPATSSWPPSRNAAPLPGINLKADLHVDLSVEQMKLNDIYINFYSPLNDSSSGTNYPPGLFFNATLQIAENLSLDVCAEKMLGNDNQLILMGMFDGLQLPSLSQFAALVGGDDLLNSLLPSSSIPPFFTTGNTVSIRSTTLTVNCSPFSVESVNLVIGLGAQTWSPLDEVVISNLEVRFRVDSPFNNQRSLQTILAGTISIGDLFFKMSASAPDFTITALLPPNRTISLKSLLGQHASEIPEIGDLSINALYLQVQPTKGFTTSAAVADQPQPLALTIGPETLTLSEIRLLINYAQGGGFSGALSGTIGLAGAQLGITYQFPGALTLRGQLPSLSMKTLVTSLCEESIAWPSGFDIDLEQSYLLIERQNTNLSLSVATEVKDLGLLALAIQRQGKWGFALGLDLNVQSLAALPGLGVLAPFESFIDISTLVLVLSAMDQQPGFQFPDLAHFQAPSLGNSSVTLPAQASGLVRGLNMYAMLNTAQSGGFQALAKYLNIHLDGTIGITLAVSLPDPTTNSKFFLSVSEEIQQGTNLTGELGVLLQGSDVGAFLSAIVKTQVQGQPIEFDVTASVLENGVLISGTMQGTIHFNSVSLSNLALVIGIDFEGIPSLGIAATLDVHTFDTALALFFDSTNPAKSMVAGALSNVTLRDIALTLARQTDLPSDLARVLGLIGLKALNAFTMPASVAASLDHRDLGAISNAFKQYGSLTIPATSEHILLVINQQGAAWHLTDMSTMKHYSLALQGNAIAVTLQPQIYITPENTFIGSIQYAQGFNVIAEIDYLWLKTQINVEISANKGIAADVDLEPIILLSRDFFSITGANDQASPRLSLSTYKQPQLPDARLRDPHFLLSGTLRLLGVDLAGIYLLISEQGLAFQISSQVNPLLHLDLQGNFDSHGNLKTEAKLVAGVANSLDLQQLGSLQINVNVNGTVDIGYDGKNPFAVFRGGFIFQGIQCNIPVTTLDANSPALRDINKLLWSQISDIITKLLKNPDQWLGWVHSGVVHLADQTAEAVGHILASVYHLSSDDIGSKTQKIMGYSLSEVTRALKGAGSSANDAINVLKNLGYQAKDISAAIPGIFSNQHADVNLGHVDTPAGPHVDSPKHIDVPGTHIDTSGHIDIAGSHIDGAVHADIPHSDVKYVGTITPHGDSNPHGDQTTTPHSDSNPHVDQTTTPHSDTYPPHTDSPVPPHGDTGTHVDVKS